MLKKLWRYGLAVLTVAVALIVTSSLEQYTDITPLFYAAIVVSAWFGGMGPGLLAVVLAALSIDYFLVPPLYTLRLGPKPISSTPAWVVWPMKFRLKVRASSAWESSSSGFAK